MSTHDEIKKFLQALTIFSKGEMVARPVTLSHDSSLIQAGAGFGGCFVRSSTVAPFKKKPHSSTLISPESIKIFDNICNSTEPYHWLIYQLHNLPHETWTDSFGLNMFNLMFFSQYIFLNIHLLCNMTSRPHTPIEVSKSKPYEEG